MGESRSEAAGLSVRVMHAADRMSSAAPET